jgi:outer membrane autotransporter protein
LAVASGGTVAPGISTLNVAGNVGFAAGSVLRVDVNAAGQSGLIAAGGFATLAGGTVQVVGAPTPSLTYTIVTAQQGVSGTFANVVTPGFVFLSPELSYTPTSVLLSLQQTRAFTSTAVTPNQVNVAAALGALPAGNPLFQAVVTQTSAAGSQQAFDALSGEIHASSRTIMLDDSRFARQAVLGRLRQAPFGGEPGPMASLGGGGPTVVYEERALSFADRVAPAESALAYADARSTAFPAKAPPLASREPETAWWTQGVGAWGKIDGDQNAAGISRDLGGFFSGIDTRFGNRWRAGIAGGYTSSNASVGSRASSATIDTTHLAAYAGANYGSWNLRSGATIGWSRLDTSRMILFPGFADSASARYNASTAQVFGEVGYGIALGAIAAEPFAGLAWVHLSTDGFNETGGSGNAALAGLQSSDDVGYSTLGARVAANYLLPGGAVLIPRASIAWQHAFGDVVPAAALAFQGTGAAFTIAGVPLAEDAALVEAGLDLPITPQATVGFSYIGRLGDSAEDHSVRGNLLVRF